MSSMPDTAQQCLTFSDIHSGAHFELKFAFVLSLCCMVDKSKSTYEQPTQMHCYDKHSVFSLSASSSDKYHAFGPLNRTILLFNINNQLLILSDKCLEYLIGRNGIRIFDDQVLELY